ncbi:hypothetical protein CsSME_00049132 [Camellia sinensis var. sinensis]
MNQNERIEQLERNRQEMQTIIEKQDDRIQKLQSTAFQLANFYFIFQGVIFTVVSNASSSVKCQDWWFPFILSFVASALNLCALLVIGIKYKRSLDQQEINWQHYQEYEQRLEQASGQEEVINNNVNNRIQLIGDPFTKKQRSAYLFVCMSLFVGFSSLTLLGCWWIRCRESDLKMLSGDDKCVKLCDTEKCIRICPEY